MDDFCTIVLFSRSSKTIVYWDDILQPYSLVRYLLDRKHDFENDKILSWGNISEEEIEKLMLHGKTPDHIGFELLSEWTKNNPEIDYLRSIFFSRSKNVE